MKKVIIAGLLAFGAYRLFANDKKETQAGDAVPIIDMEDIPVTDTKVPDAATFFRNYEGWIVIDSAGHYMLVKGGKLYTPESLESFKAWESANPNRQVTVGYNAWEIFSPGNYVGGF